MERHLLKCDDCREKLALIIYNLSQDVAETDLAPLSASDCDIDDILSKILPGKSMLRIQ